MRKPAELGSPRWWTEVIEETLDDLQPILDDMGETLLGEVDRGWAPGVEPDKSTETITLDQLLTMPVEAVQEVLTLMASQPQTQAKAAQLAAEYLAEMGAV